MKKIGAAIALVTLLILCGRICPAAVFSQTSPVKISIALPTESLIVDDLDARDQFNRPIHSISRRSEFIRLWSQSLNQKILNALTPLHLQMLAILNSCWKDFTGFIQQAAEKVLVVVKIWFSSKKLRSAILTVSRFSETRLLTFHVQSHQDGSVYLFLLSSVISSTRLLR